MTYPFSHVSMAPCCLSICTFESIHSLPAASSGKLVSLRDVNSSVAAAAIFGGPASSILSTSLTASKTARGDVSPWLVCLPSSHHLRSMAWISSVDVAWACTLIFSYAMRTLSCESPRDRSQASLMNLYTKTASERVVASKSFFVWLIVSLSGLMMSSICLAALVFFSCRFSITLS